MQFMLRLHYFVGIAAALLACGPQPSPRDPLDAAPKIDALLPTCTPAGQVFGIDTSENRVLLTQGAPLPVTQGFQGFLFIRVGLHSPSPLPDAVQMSVVVQLDNGVEQYLPQRTVKTQVADGGAETVEVPIFFNDSVMADLVSRKAVVDMEVETPACVMRAHADAVLSLGAYMGADAGFWGTSGD